MVVDKEEPGETGGSDSAVSRAGDLEGPGKRSRTEREGPIALHRFLARSGKKIGNQ